MSAVLTEIPDDPQSEDGLSYGSSDLYAEILSLIASRADRGLSTSRSWLVLNVLLSHPLKRHHEDEPDDFTLCCRQLAASAAVDHALARLRYQGGDEPEAIPPPGYVHLRRVYPVRRDGVIMLVPIEDLADEEIAAKVATYRASSRGFADHADELRRYLRARRSNVVKLGDRRAQI